MHVARLTVIHCISRDWPNYVTFGKAPRVYAVSVEGKMITYACLQKKAGWSWTRVCWPGGCIKGVVDN